MQLFDRIRSATQAPVIDAVRVPPSASSTSQSTVICRSPSAPQVDHGAQRPADQPLDLLRPARLLARAASRRVRVVVARGSMPYSAVTQPCPVLAQERRHALLDARRAQHIGVAEPDQARALGLERHPGSMVTARIWSGAGRRGAW